MILQHIIFNVVLHIFRCCTTYFCDVRSFYILMLHLRTGCVGDGGQGRDGERDPVEERSTMEDGVPWRNWVQWENGESGHGGERE